MVLVLAQNGAWTETVALVVHATRQGMRMCVANENYNFMFTGEFMCTHDEQTIGHLMLVTRRDEAPPGGTLITQVGRSDVRER